MAQDRSRSAFDVHRPKHWSGLQAQQGRLLSDDDWNEADAIDKEDLRRTRADVIGPSGSPNAGFTVANPRATGGRIDFDLLPGTIYVGGLRVTLEDKESFALQRDWLQQRESDRDLVLDRIDKVYLEVWQQPVTAVEDEELLEVALGGPDSSVRLRTMRRVRVLAGVAQEDCDAGWAEVVKKLGKLSPDNELTTDATLTVGYLPNTGGAGPSLCAPSAQGGYLGAENQAIRVEIGAGGGSVLWGFDNASPLYRVRVTVDGAGAQVVHFLEPPRDEVHWPMSGQVVELLPWSAVLPNNQKVAETSGFPAKVAASYDPTERTITVVPPVPATFGSAWQTRSDAASLSTPADSFFYLRVWNRGADTASPAQQPFTAGTPLTLTGTGLTVTLTGTSFRPGDFWIIAARPDSPARVVPWRLESGREPEGIRRFYAPLALIHWRPSGAHTVFDCRETFAPLTRARGCCLTLMPDSAWQHRLASVADDPDICVCFQPGDYATDRPLIFTGKNVRIHGAGGASRIHGKGIETALLFTGCASVDVSDLTVDADITVAGQGDLPHLGGAITTVDCDHVEISGVRARCASGPLTSATSITVYNGFAATRARDASVRVRGCDLVVGANQIGLSVINYGRVTITDNTTRVDATENRELPIAWLSNKEYLRRFRRTMIYRYGLLAPDEQPPAGAGAITVGDVRVWIAAEPRVIAAWDTVADWRRLPARRRDHRAVGEFLYDLAEDIARGLGTVGVHTSVTFRSFLQDILAARSSVTGVRTVAARGIVVGGVTAEDVRVCGNTVWDAVQGIHVGVSTKRFRTPGAGASDAAGRVVVADNTVHITLLPESVIERHGIFVGSCRSLLVENNMADCEKLATAKRLAIDGIRVFGYVGPMAALTRNHLSGFSTGIRVVPLNNDKDGSSSMWRVAGNIAVGAGANNTVNRTLPSGAVATHVGLSDNLP